jgi:hypothetical protein
LREAADERQGAGVQPGERGNKGTWISPPGLISCLTLDCFSTLALFEILMDSVLSHSSFEGRAYGAVTPGYEIT